VPPTADPVPAEPGRVGQQRREPLHPAVHRDMIHLDATLGQQLLHIPIGQPEPQIPAHRKHDHFGWEPEASERRGSRSRNTSRSDEPHAAGYCPNPTRQSTRQTRRISGQDRSGSLNATDPAGHPAPEAPRVQIPNRAILLFTGAVGVLRDAPALAWYGSAQGRYQEPHLVWPEDQTWCLACEVDEEIEFTVGCSVDASQALAGALPGAVRRVHYGDPAPLYRDPA
jgi:hypothetical protein